MSREELNQVVPAPPAFSGPENDPQELVSHHQGAIDIPQHGIDNSQNSLRFNVADERSLYFDAQGAHDSSIKNSVRRDDINKDNRRQTKIDDVSKNDDSFVTAVRDQESRYDQTKEYLHIANSILAPRIFQDGDSSHPYDSLVPQDPSQYESAIQDMLQESYRENPSEGINSERCLIDEMYDESEKRKPSVVQRKEHMSSSFQMQHIIAKSRTLQSPKRTPPPIENRNLSLRQRRSCENLLETSDMSSRSSTSTPRPSELRSRTSTSPEVLIQRFRKSPMPTEDMSPRSRIPILNRVINDGSTQTLLGDITQNVSAGINRSSRYENSSSSIDRKVPLGVVDIVMSPPGNDDESLSTRSLLSERRGSRSTRLLSSGHDDENNEDANNIKFYQRTTSHEDMAMADLTPALRKRRGVDKYVTDESQLNLRFQRRRTRPMSDVNPPPQALLNSRNRPER